MKYYLLLSFWELVDALSRDCILQQDEPIILSTIDWDSDYSICIDEQILDVDKLHPIAPNDPNSTQFVYPQNIELYYDFVSFRFKTKELQNNFIQKTSILLDIKGIDKYQDHFTISHETETYLPESFIRKQSIPQINKQSDNQYKKDQLRGALIAYVQGETLAIPTAIQEIILNAKKLKNSLAGLHTSIMINEHVLPPFDTYLDLVSQCQKEYQETIGENNLNFDTLTDLIIEIRKLTEKRIHDLSNKDPQSISERLSILQQKITKIEERHGIIQLRQELNKIKKQEKLNGKKEGKTRKYFKRNTPEYKKKQEIEKKLDEFEQDNPDYLRAKQELDSLSHQTDKYTTTIGALCTRLSDLSNNIIHKLSQNVTIKNSLDVSKISINPVTGIRFQNREESEEIAYLNEILSIIFSQENTAELSEGYILSLIERSANAFKATQYAQTKRGEQLINELRNYYLYKTNRAHTFTLPTDMPILCSIFAFFLKFLGYQQIERYMQNKKLSESQYAYTLLGACNGYSKMPRDLTHRLYSQHKELVREIDLLLLKTYK